MKVIKTNESILTMPLVTDNTPLVFDDLDDEVFSDIEDTDVLDDVFELDEPDEEAKHETPALGIESAVASQLNALIIDEFEAIQGYNSTIVSLENEPNCESIIKVLKDIVYEENVHVGQLQEILKTVSPNAVGIKEGADEAEEQIMSDEQVPMTTLNADDAPEVDDTINFSKAEDIDYDVTTVPSDIAHPFMKVDSFPVTAIKREENKPDEELSLESECEVLDADDEM